MGGISCPFSTFAVQYGLRFKPTEKKESGKFVQVLQSYNYRAQIGIKKRN